MSKDVRFEAIINNKRIIFDSTLRGIVVSEVVYESNDDGVLIYDKIAGLTSNTVECQLSTNTSALIPALRILETPYHQYFDLREVIESQNDITFYWNASRLAAFYNRYSTDGVDLEKREPIIRSAVEFLTQTKYAENFLPEEKLKKLGEACKLLGFYEGFPIFDASHGLPRLQSRLGIHIGNDSVLISTPLDSHAGDVMVLAEIIERRIGRKGYKKKNRVRFEKDQKLMGELMK